MLENIKELFTEFSWDNPIMVAIIAIVAHTIIFIIVYFILKWFVKFLLRALKKRDKKGRAKAETLSTMIKQILKYGLILIYILTILSVIGIDTASIIAGAGIVGVVAAFAFQDLLSDVVAGIAVVAQDIYDVGDYVEINGNQGNVISLGLKTTTIRSFTGETCTINNRNVGNVRNYTKAENALAITLFRVAANTDIKVFYELFEAHIDEIAAKYPQIIEKPKIVGTNLISDWAIEFQVNTRVKPETQWQFRRSMGDELVKLCQENNIQLPGTKE